MHRYGAFSINKKIGSCQNLVLFPGPKVCKHKFSQKYSALYPTADVKVVANFKKDN